MHSELLTKYLDKTASPEEKEEVHAWLADERSDMGVYYHLLDERWAHFTTTEKMDHVRVLGNLRDQIQQSHSKKGRIITLLRRSVNVAACIALVIWAGIAVKRNDTTPKKQVWELVKNNSYNSKRIIMPDSSVIILSGHGSISYNNGYNINNRSIKLKGEAWFNVQKKESLSFEVSTRTLTTKVLGTSFNIEAYEDEPDTRVSLIQGKVAVQLNTGGSPLLLAPGNTLCYNVTSNTKEIYPIAIKDNSGWGKGNLLFNNIPLAEVLNRIARLYNLKITCSDTKIQLNNKRVTAVFRNETSEEILKSILFVHGLKLIKKDRKNYMITR